MDGPNYTWRALSDEQVVRRQMAALKIKCAEEKRRQEFQSSSNFYPFPSMSNSMEKLERPSTSAMPQSRPLIRQTERMRFNASPQRHFGESSRQGESFTIYQPKIQYSIDEMKTIASKMQLSVLLNKEKRSPCVFLQKTMPPPPMRKTGLYRCVQSLEQPEPLHEVLNKLTPRKPRIIRKANLELQVHNNDVENRRPRL